MRTYAYASGTIFSLIASAQLARAVFALPVHVADLAIPIWCSYVAFLALGAMGVWAFRSATRQA